MTTTEPDGPVPPDFAGGLSFPPGFKWGAATAAYQIEGAATEDGRGVSVWDTFSRQPGNVQGGDTGDIACDNYHRYPQDTELMAGLGLNAYRLSIAWPRIQPGGRGPALQAGLDHYRRVLDGLLERGIAPAVTLFHWDLPQELQDEGGWASRDTALRFAEFAAIMAQALGDRAERWITVNEPQVVESHGYRNGVHAPGIRDNAAAVAATHHLLLGHGLAVHALRDLLPAGTPVGISLDLRPVRTLSPGPGSSSGDFDLGLLEQARAITDADVNGLFLEPLLRGRYPAEARTELVPGPGLIRDGDMDTISAPIDFLGVNYYAPAYLRPGDPNDLRRYEEPADCGVPGVVGYAPEWLERTPMGWLVDPDALYELLVRLSKDAPDWTLMVTENGCAALDYISPEGAVHDVDRVRYLHGHLAAVARAAQDGARLGGYYVWSLLDNFEWAWGYSQRFGIVYVDFGSQQRIPKSSAAFFAAAAQANAVPPLPPGAGG
jgi:beta-glucosidase